MQMRLFMENLLKKALQTFANPEILGCHSVVESITGYTLKEFDRTPFLNFHEYITNPQPDFITNWRNDPAQEKWYHKFTNGILSDVQNTFACVLYHYDHIINMEQAVIKGIKKYNYKNVLKSSTFVIGNTLALDFEYQAFILAVRRCLDYLARAISAYFKNDFHSFRKFGEFLKKKDSPLLTKHLIDLHAQYIEKFEFVLSKGDRKSVRDQISHYGYISAGCINLGQKGLILAGGGEKLGPAGKDTSVVLLSTALQKHMANLRSCVRCFITAYVDGIRKDQDEKKHL